MAVDCVHARSARSWSERSAARFPAGRRSTSGCSRASSSTPRATAAAATTWRGPHRALESDELRADQVPAEALVAHAEECVRLRGCLAQLCRSQRTVVLMRLLEELPGDDVAAALGITRGHVDVLLHRAKASLRACMTDTAT